MSAPAEAHDDDAPLAHWEGVAVDALRQAWGLPRLEVRRHTGSTNDDARALAEGGAPAGAVAMADAQSAGRGRRGRAWADVPGRSVLLSMVWRPAGPAPGAAPLRAGLAVAQALEGFGAAGVQVKWPNDVLVDGRKVAGILCEGVLGGPAPYLVVGVGVNVAQEPADFSSALTGAATSLRLVLGSAPSRCELAAALVARLLAAGPRATDVLDPAELAELAARDALAGRAVEVDGTPAGTVTGVAPDGALHVQGADGGQRQVRHGTVRPLTTADLEADG